MFHAIHYWLTPLIRLTEAGASCLRWCEVTICFSTPFGICSFLALPCNTIRECRLAQSQTLFYFWIVMEKRLLGRQEGRTDDNIESIKKRFRVSLCTSCAPASKQALHFVSTLLRLMAHSRRVLPQQAG